MLAVLDLSEDYITISTESRHAISQIETTLLWDEPETAAERFLDYLQSKEFPNFDKVAITVPVRDLNHQVITLPEAVNEKDKLVLLGLERDVTSISKNFNYRRLAVTERLEEETSLCDYLLLSLKPSRLKQLELFLKATKLKVDKITPSFLFFSPATHEEGLSATAWVGNHFTEIVVWGQNDPLSMAAIPNNGDQMEDINRFLNQFLDHVSNLSVKEIRLYGPKMRDEGLTFSLSYPSKIISDPKYAIVKSLSKLLDISYTQFLDISIEKKLPKPPIPINARNIVFATSAFAACLLIVFTSFIYAKNSRLEMQLNTLRAKEAQNRTLSIKVKQLEREEAELEQKKEFYLSITKRRTPWDQIMEEITALTPKNLWFERLSGSRSNIQISGKAMTAEDVSSFSINLNNNARYFTDAQIIGVRDYEEGRKTYTEFQLAAKLLSPSRQFVAR